MMQTTQVQLIQRLANAEDNDAWEAFAKIYFPTIVRSLHCKGLKAEDAEDVAQQVMMSVARFLAGQPYDQDRARFRTLLETITRNAAINALRDVRRDKATGGSDMLVLLSELPDGNDDAEILEREHRKQLVRTAAVLVEHEFEPDTWQAFWRTMVDGVPIDQVAKDLGKQVGSIYAARSRVMKRIRVEITRLEPSMG
jgi:RNA polymerase sigma-70 factor, ECF subfamily